MYAVLCSPQYWPLIEQTINSRGDQILMKAAESDIDTIAEIKVRHLIIDITAISDYEKFIKAIDQIRISNGKTQIIIIAPNYEPGNELLHTIVSMGVHDIIAPVGEPPDILDIISLLVKYLDQPSTYEQAVKWKADKVSAQKVKNVTLGDNKLELIKERLVGTTTISIGNLQHGSGSTHTALTVAKYLSMKGFRVGMVELKQRNDYGLIYLPRKESYSQTSFKYETFDIYANDGEVTSDDLLIAAMSKNYNYIVLDCGLIFEHDLENAKLDKASTQIKKYEKGIFYNDFMKADVKIVNTFASIQFADSIEYLMNYLNVWNITDLKILFNFTNEEILKDYRKLLDSKIYLTPYNTTLSLTEDQEDFYGKLLEKIIPKNRTTKEGMSIGKSINNLISISREIFRK